MPYTAYVLSIESRKKLLKELPPKYESIVAHHITVEFPGEELPEELPIKVYGKVDSEDGLETFLCSVGDDVSRSDGGMFHITWSLIPDKYKPVDSNELIKGGKFTFFSPITIEATPAVLG